jgi:hypothetical protein
MFRRVFLSGIASAIALPAFANGALLSAPGGTEIYANDGTFVGRLRSRPRETGSGIRLYVNVRGSRVYKHLRAEMLMDVPASKVTLNANGILLNATAAELRKAMQQHNPREGTARVLLR